MADIPMQFTRAMILAMLAGTKTKTRRVARPQPTDGLMLDSLLVEGEDRARVAYGRVLLPRKVAYAAGDRIWVREAWHTDVQFDHLPPRDLPAPSPVRYLADWAWQYSPPAEGRERRGMHMPRWASRLTLNITGVQPERVQAISDDDCLKEGIPIVPVVPGVDVDAEGNWRAGRARYRFQQLWDSINEGRGFGWDANPWVWAIDFELERRNIDGA